MSDEQYERHKKALATLRLEKPKKLSSQCAIFWNEISNQHFNFDRANIEVAYLMTITREQLLNFYKVQFIFFYTIFLHKIFKEIVYRLKRN